MYIGKDHLKVIILVNTKGHVNEFLPKFLLYLSYKTVTMGLMSWRSKLSHHLQCWNCMWVLVKALATPLSHQDAC